MPDIEEIRSDWRTRAQQHKNDLYATPTPATWRYFAMAREHAATSVNAQKVLPFLALPLMPLSIQAKRMVELGSSFSYYPMQYGDPPDRWGVSEHISEGGVSTRLMLSACKLLRQAGVEATLCSIDIRGVEPHPVYGDLFGRLKHLLGDLDLLEPWRPFMGTDTREWLRQEADRIERGEAEPIDFALVDSNHTYDQVRTELDALLPVISERGIILVDDCYDTEYMHGADWIPEETKEGLRRGGEYGAILEFIEAHPEWQPDWLETMVLLRRR
jgi:hypothetical protein